MIEAKFLSKDQRLKNVNFRLGNGFFYAIFGEEKSGKTTLLNLLSGIETPSEGEVRINGYGLLCDPKKAKSLFGAYPSQDMFPKRTTVMEFLSFLASVRRIPSDRSMTEIHSLLESFGLSSVTDRLIENLSDREKALLGILQTTLGKSVVSFADDFPPDSFEAESEDLFALLRNAFADKTFFFSTDKPEIAKFADEVLVLENGELVAEIQAEKFCDCLDENGSFMLPVSEAESDSDETAESEGDRV